jgi:hypothetical protein
MITICQWHVGEICQARQACIDQLRANLPENVGYELIRDPVPVMEHHKALEPSQTIRRDSGLVRLTLLMENPDRMWLDTDMKINEWPVIEENKTYIYGGSCPAAALYLKGTPIDKIKQILEEFAKTNLMCLHCLLYGLPGNIRIPVKSFEHLLLKGV